MSVISANKHLIGYLTAALITATATFEGTRYYAYYDVVGVPTVCQGYTGKGIVFGKKYTQEECKRYLETELKEHSLGMLNCVKVPLSDGEYIAYTMFAYNVGVNAFCTSKSVAAKLNLGDREGACDGLLKWVYAGGVFYKGLLNRRMYERAICLGQKPTN